MSYNSGVRLKAISKQLGDFSLKNINLEAKPKEVIGIIGENGAGKTTLLKILGRLLELDSGDMSIPSKENVGFVFDSNHIPEELNSREVNTIMSYIFINWDSNLFIKYIDEFSLPLKKEIGKFSKGMKTKLNIAIALSHKPAILLLDEITSGLDPLIKDQLLKVVKSYVNNNQATAIITTHILDDILKISDKVIALDNGEIVLNENVSDFKNVESLGERFNEIITKD